MILDQFRLDGKVALVTGGGRGIGRAIALALAEAGADVAVASRTVSEIESVKAEIAARGRRGLAVAVDSSSVESIHEMVHTVVGEFGRLDVAVPAAGMTRRKPLVEVTEDDYDAVMGVNLRGVYFTCQAAARVMIPQGGGKLILIASLSSERGIANVSIYTTTKTGVLGLVRALGNELGQHRINVNAIGPGYHNTALTTALFQDEQWVAHATSRTPLGRTGTAEDLAGAAVFLASTASDYMTGQVVYVDGGWLAAL